MARATCQKTSLGVSEKQEPPPRRHCLMNKYGQHHLNQCVRHSHNSNLFARFEMEAKLSDCRGNWITGLLLSVSSPYVLDQPMLIRMHSVYLTDAWWMMLSPLLLPLLKLLPRPWKNPWLQ